MRKNLITGLTALALVWLTCSAAYSQSAYFQAMTNLNPCAYFPLQETNPVSQGDIETNYGSLGAVANAIYASTAITKGQSGVTGDGDTCVSDSDANGGFAAVPNIDPRTGVQSSTFTVEAWVNPAETNRNFEGILAKSGGNTGGINAANNQAGFCLSQNYIAYLDNSNLKGFDFHVYNGVGHGGAEAVVPFNVQLTTWYHVVGVYDGTNCWIFINGTNEIAAGVGYQIPMTGSYVPDTWNQIQIGTSRNQNGNNYHGFLDEMAIYTNVLTATQIQNHYAAYSGTGYFSTVMSDNPYMYWRMDSPAYTGPAFSTYPVATNYGVNATTYLGNYGTASQPGIPGPQLPGLLDPSNGNASFGVQINGIGGNYGATPGVPIGYTTAGVPFYIATAVPFIIQPDSLSDPNALLMNRTNRQPYSVTIWFEGKAYDWSRFATIMGHSDNNWRVAMANGGNAGRLQFAPGIGNSGAVVTHLAYDDGNWHQFVGTYDGSNILVYVDGNLENFTANTGNLTSSSLDVVLGGDPQYANSGNTVPAGTTSPGIGAYGNRDFCGAISQFAFFTNTLTSAQVASLYASATPASVPAYAVAQPVTGRVNPAPANLFFAFVVGGTPTLSYQWYFNTSSNYSGATPLVNDGVKYFFVNTIQMTISNLVPTDSGYYFCIASNNFGSVTSILASLSVNLAPVITAQNPTANFSLFPNQTFTLSVTTTSDTNSLIYQWYTNSVANGAQTGSSYPITATANLAGMTFQCIVTNLYGSATSAPVTLTISPFPAALTNSPFGSNILALNPTAYWPMHETGETPVAAEVETNYGSLGSAGLGYYDDWRTVISGTIQGNLVSGGLTTNLFVLHNFPSAIAGDPNPSVELSGANRSYIVIPHASTNLTLTPPFTLEGWVKPLINTYFIMMSEDLGTFNTSSAKGGFDWQYAGTVNSFSMSVYNGNGSAGSEPKTAPIYPPGYWYHVVTTYDGTNVQYYINGVADAMTGINGTNGTYAAYNPNTWDPITIGCGRGLNGNPMNGALDEVAVYTNLLPLSEIQKHYNDGTNAGYHAYKADVLADNPLLYYRMDSPAYTLPPISQWPVLTNYGSMGLNGFYTPGAVPGGVAGPSEDGASAAGLAANTALGGNGSSIFADAGFNSLFNPIGKTPFTIAAWMRGFPADDGGVNWQSIMSRSDWGWRMDLDSGNGYINFNIGNGGGAGLVGGSDIGNGSASRQVNDGQWHFVTGTFDGTNTILWVDGLKTASASANNINLTNNVSIPTFIGAYPNTGSQSSAANYLANEISRVFAGSLCEAAFWNGVALTTNQVQAIYSAAQVAPVIGVQPVSGFANESAGYTNKVIVAGTPPLSYQWYKNNQPMPLAGQTNFPAGFGPTNSTLILYPISTNDQSLNYFVVITNNYGAVTSAVWSINPVFTLPVFTNDIANTNFILYAGGHAAFSVLAVGAQPISYRWYSNNVVISGATGRSYTAANVNPPNVTNIYYCVASNFVGVATSSVAIVDIIGVPSVIPYSLTVMTDNPTGFWPMDETNGGALSIGAGVVAIADDYAGGNDGLYTNCVLGQPGFNSSDSNRTSVQFGSLTLQSGDVYNISTNVDFSATNGASSNFSVEGWVNGYQQTVDAGIITKGYGGGGEQFNLDCGSGSGPAPHAFRFFFRDASGATHAINSTNNPTPGIWHHLVAVVNETNGQVILYIDGSPVGMNSFSPGLGVLASTRSMTIGARPSNATTNLNDFQFVGNIQDVAVYNYALSAQQVLNHYFAADIPASVINDVNDETACQNGTAMFTTTIVGTPPVGYQWYDGNSGLPIAGATNTTFFTNNVQNTDSYYLVATNNYGTNQTRTASLNVVSGGPQVVVQPPATTFVPKGYTISVPVTVMGTLPMTNQWQMSDTNAVTFTNLTDNARISGSQQIWLNMTNTQPSVLTITPARVSDGGDYQLATTNGTSSSLSTIANVIVGTLPIGFNGNGVGWTANQGGTYANPPIVDNVWEGTEAAFGSETRTFFFQYPQYIGAFRASFTYQDLTGGGNVADGLTFCLQNDTRGAAAIGGGGGSLAYSGVTPSWSLQFNIYPSYNNAASPNSGYGFAINGAITPTPFPTPGTINLGSADPINVTLTYLNGNVSLVMTDSVANTSFSATAAYNLPSILGASTAYVGFTAADGGSQATQIVTNFTFVSLASESISVSNSTNAVVSWNGLIQGYTLQQNGNLTTTNWVDVPAADIVTNGLHKVTVPIGGTNMFYRLNSSD